MANAPGANADSGCGAFARIAKHRQGSRSVNRIREAPAGPAKRRHTHDETEKALSG